MKNHLLDKILVQFDSHFQEKIYTDKHLNETHRQVSGAFYTPVSVVLQMTNDALEALLTSRLELTATEAVDFLAGNSDLTKGQAYLKRICVLSWMDLASGTGVFALVYLEVLGLLCKHYKLHQDHLKTAAMNMFVNDLDSHAILTFKQLCDLPVNCIVGDALTSLKSNPKVALILLTGGFDTVMGNPPYVGERGNKGIFEVYRKHPDLAPYYVARMDLFYFFLHLGMDILKDGGVLCQITTHYFSTADGGWKLREHLKREMAFTHVRLARSCDAFEGVKQLSVVSFTAIKSQNKVQMAQCFDYLEWRHNEPENHSSMGAKSVTRNQSALFDAHGQLIIDPQQELSDVMHYMLKGSGRVLSDIVQVNQGVVSGMDRERSEQSSKPVFVYEKAELPQDATTHLFKPFIKNGMIKPYRLLVDRDLFLMYTDGVDIEEYPDCINRLNPYRERLSNRREVKNGVRQWYQLQWGRDANIFETRKIVCPQRATRNTFCFLNEPYYASADVYFMINDSLEEYELQGLAAYLNSPIVHAWLFQHGKRKGRLLELYATPLKRIPVPTFSPEEYRRLSQFYTCLSATYTAGVDSEKDLHEWVCDFFEIPRGKRDALWEWHIVSIQT